MKSLTLLSLSLTIFLSNCSNSSTSSNSTSKSEIAEYVKLKPFNNIENLRTDLSKNGIGDLHDWKSDGMGGFMSITDYFQFGIPARDNYMKNNLAYYLESMDERYVQTLKLVLNINNANDENNSLSAFAELTKKTFSSLSIEIPSVLIESIKKAKEYHADYENYSVILQLEKSNIETWKLTIETK